MSNYTFSTEQQKQGETCDKAIEPSVSEFSSAVPQVKNVQKRIKKRKWALQKMRQYTQVLNIDVETPIKHLDFSQRRYNGFRNQIEFDKKRIVIAGDNEYSVHGYESFLRDTSYVLLHE